MLTPPGARHHRALLIGAVLLAGTGALAGVAETALATPLTTSYATTGAPATFTVPCGVRSIHALAIGGRGGSNGYAGGLAAKVEADLGVMPGQLEVRVAGNGGGGTSTPGGYNGGGGASVYAGGASGGGASDIRTTAGDPASRILVAGGGGGSGYGYDRAANGGDAGSRGQGDDSFGGPGEAGTQSGGGAGGWSSVGGGGGAGTLGQGGGAGVYWYWPYRGAGGGGGGYFGGGGGGSFASGGGGSSFFGATATGTSTALNSAAPLVSITYDKVLTVDQCSLAYGATPTQGTSAPKSVILTNEGGVAVTLTGEDFDFSAGSEGEDYLVSSSTCRGSLAVGASCTVRVRFAPQGTGSSASSLILSGAETVSGAETPPVYIALSGTATGLPQGPAGTNGSDGAGGINGSDGANGTDGVNGTNGTDGVNGAEGAGGAIGTTGAPGPTGATGGLDTLLEVVECHRSRVRAARNIECWFRYTPGKDAQLKLSFRRQGVALATGVTIGTGGIQKVALKAKKRLRGGLYLLALSYRTDGVQHSATRSASIR